MLYNNKFMKSVYICFSHMCLYSPNDDDAAETCCEFFFLYLLGGCYISYKTHKQNAFL